MIKKAKVFYIFPATYDTETKEVRTTKSWVNKWPLDLFTDLLKLTNLFLYSFTGKYIKWLVWHED